MKTMVIRSRVCVLAAELKYHIPIKLPVISTYDASIKVLRPAKESSPIPMTVVTKLAKLIIAVPCTL